VFSKWGVLMYWDHVVKNGILVDSNKKYKANIYIKGEVIAAVSETELGGEARKTTDAKGCHVFPGFIDTHIHSRDPGATYKEDFFHSTQAAAAGGITTVFEMPSTTPPVNNITNFNKQIKNLKSKAHVDFALWGICLGKLNNKDIQSLNEAGVIGFKFFWGYAINKKTYQLIYNYTPDMENVLPPFNDGEVYEIFKEVSKTGKLIAVHAENNHLIQYLTREVKNSGQKDYEALIKSRPELAEETTIQTAISFAKDTGAHLHILHLSSESGVELVKKAQDEGYPVTAETCPHYLYLCNEDYNKLGSIIKIYPLVKYKKDQNRLWQAVKEGIITHICSDHAPHTEEEKNGDLWSIPAGIAGVETLAPLMIDAVSKEKITIEELSKLLSENPAKLFGIYPQKGSLQIGTDADITIVDFNKKHAIKKEKLHSKSRVTAYDGFEICGKPVTTIVRGKTVMENGKIVSNPCGQPLKTQSRGQIS
jgi:allantoinase